jgi:hypothetical protein
MGIAHPSIVRFRVWGDDLGPDTVTAVLGCSPSVAWRKGDQRIGRKTGQIIIH